MKSLCILCACVVASAANAHNLFPAKIDDGYGLKFWADDHWEQAIPEKVIGLTAYDNAGKRIKVGYDYQNGKVEIKEQPALMTAEYDFGYYTFTTDEHIHKPREEVKGFIYDTRHIYKLGKTIFSWGEKSNQPVGLKLEVTPQSNPLALKVGDKLEVLVTLDGKPYSSAEFEDQAGDLDDVKIDSNGMATITLRKPEGGYQIIGASAKLPYQLHDDNAQTLHLTGTLAFPMSE